MKTFLLPHFRYTLFAICLASLNILFAQDEQATRIEQENRLEIPYDEYKYDVNIMPLGENGLLSYREVYEFNENGEILWEFTKYDTLFNTTWINRYYLPTNYNYVGYHNEGNNFYVLFTRGDYQNSHFKILKINNYNGELKAFDDKFLIPLHLTEFKVLNNSAFFCGIVKDNPAIVLYNVESKKSKVLPAIYQKNAQFVSLDFEPNNDIFNVTLSHRLYGNKTTVSVKTYTIDGELVNNIALKPTQNQNLLTGKMTVLENGDRFVTGTYSNYRNTEYSKGMFISKIANGEQEFIEYYPYTELKNFFSYMRPKRQIRVKEKIKRMKSMGKEIKWSYRLYMHDIIPLKDRFIVVGEAYYPQYRQESFYYGNTPTRYFEGYRYTHAIVCGFDSKGNLLWDNSFEILDALSPYLNQLVKVKPSNDKIYLLYNHNNEVKTKVVNGYEVLEEKASEKIKTNFTNDIVERDNKIGGSEYWYKDYFLAWGTQDIRNYKDNVASNNRKVFYMNKLRVK